MVNLDVINDLMLYYKYDKQMKYDKVRITQALTDSLTAIKEGEKAKQEYNTLNAKYQDLLKKYNELLANNNSKTNNT